MLGTATGASIQLPVPSRKRRFLRHLIVAVVTVVCCAAAGIGVLVYFSLHTLGPDLGRAVGRAVGDMASQGAYEASSAASVARSQGVTYGDVTLQELQARYPKDHWLAATTPSRPTNGTFLNVSIEMSEDHIITAVNMGGGVCSWGLDVQASNDPIVVADGLPGAGVFATYVVSTNPSASVCDAASAPTSRWFRASPSAMRDDAGS